MYYEINHNPGWIAKCFVHSKEALMKRLTPFVLGALLGALLLAVFTLGQASASPLAATGCFSDTNGHWAETFICWMKEKGISGGYPDGTYKPANNVTRAEMAVMMQKQSQIPPTVADHYFNSGPNSWAANSGVAGAYVEPFTIRTHLAASTTGTKYFQVTPTLPSTLYGKTTYFKGVLFCYETVSGAVITSVNIRHEKFYGASGVFETLNTLTDDTDRTGYGCRLYQFATAYSYYPDNTLLLLVGVTFPTTAAYVSADGVAFILSASDLGPGYIYGLEAPSFMQEANPDIVPSYGPEEGE